MFESPRAEIDWIWQRCRNRLPSALALSLAFKAVNFVVLVPLSAVILRACLTRWGRASVGNFELVSFFISPAGIVALLGVGGLLLTSLYLEVSGLIRLLADGRLHWWQAFKGSTLLLPRLAELGLRQLAMYVVLALPFLACLALVFWWLLSGKDLNGLIILKPPEFWWGAGVAGVIATGYALVAAVYFLRRIYAVPILTFEPGFTAAAALRASVERSHGTLWRSGGVLLFWFAIQASVAAVVTFVLHMGLRSVLSHSSSSLAMTVFLVAVATVINVLVALVLGILANLTFAGAVLSLYRHVAPEGALPSEASFESRPRRSVGWMLGVALLVLAVGTVAASVLTIRDVELNEDLEITAHRAGATAAPENTVAALKQAIADGADWAEIDVQLTADEELVIMHDIDLARVGGGNRRVDQATLAEIQALDVGTAFATSFAGEQIPTLTDMLSAAAGKIRLNVELKPHGTADASELTRRVIAELRQAGMVDECRLCSQSYESLQLARQLEPRLDVGYIVATVIGDPTKLDANFLMVKSSLATRQFADRARLHGVAVHAWTVNDPALVAPLLDAGVANLITDDPARIRARLNEIRALGTAERLLLRAGHAIAQP